MISSLREPVLGPAQEQLGSDLARVVTYDERMSEAARNVGLPTARPT